MNKRATNPALQLENLWQKVQGRLDELNPRERKLVGYGALLTGLILCWWVLIDPAMRTLEGSAARLEALAQKAGAVERAAQDLQALQGARSRVQVQPAELNTRLARLLADEGLKDSTTLTRSEEGMLRLDLNSAPAGAVLKWLAQAEALSGVKTAEMKVQKQDAGVVSGYILFATPVGSASVAASKPGA